MTKNYGRLSFTNYKRTNDNNSFSQLSDTPDPLQIMWDDVVHNPKVYRRIILLCKKDKVIQ
jgi:hypothetical protein